MGHDVLTTDITKQKKELGKLDNDWVQEQLDLDHRKYEFSVSHLNPSLYSKKSGYVDSNRIPHRFGGF